MDRCDFQRGVRRHSVKPIAILPTWSKGAGVETTHFKWEYFSFSCGHVRIPIVSVRSLAEQAAHLVDALVHVPILVLACKSGTSSQTITVEQNE